MHSHVHLLFTLEGSTSTLHTSTLRWSGSRFTMSFPIRCNRSRGDDCVFFITTAAWTAVGKTCVTLLLNRFLHLDLFTVRERNRAAKHQSNCSLPFNYTAEHAQHKGFPAPARLGEADEFLPQECRGTGPLFPRWERHEAEDADIVN